MKKLAIGSVLLVCSFAPIRSEARELTLDERTAAQRAIEQVYWNHRVWPTENPGRKPPLSAVMPDSTIRAKVEDYLRMSALLDSFWHEPIRGEQLQAEIGRMARETRAPETLRELFAALDDDPFLIAECLARPTLARRLVAAAFARDERLHGAQRAALLSKLTRVRDLEALEHIDGDHVEMTFVLNDGDTTKRARSNPNPREIQLTRKEWNIEIRRLSAAFGNASEPVPGISPDAGIVPDTATLLSALPVGRVSRIVDLDDQFVMIAVRKKSATSVTVTSVSWTKRGYGEWAREAAGSLALDASAVAPPGQGYSATTLALSVCVDDTWTPTSEGANAPDARFSQTAVWTGTEMIIWGGYGTYNLSTGGRYNPSTNSWISSSLTTGSGLHVPEGRSVHTAVWTGTEMIVWGGYGSESGFQGLNTGGRYNPSTDTWADSILVAGTADRTPSGRFRPIAVWTGTEMIIWGGYNGIAPEFPNTGGRYNPSSDSWAICSLTEGTGANVPDGREYFTAVWTDTEMIVWGGDSNIGYLKTGGRYKPSTDSWATTTLTAGTGAYIPARRGYHTAIWTGSEMIVWGGYNDIGGGQALKDGGRYNPATDQWAHSSLTEGTGANLPPARDSHTAVWTGSEMIVWGGNGRTTGGRYNPSTDLWAASSLFNGTGANVPTGRTRYTAVWTGSTDRRMIIWGGLPLTASGGLYCAQALPLSGCVNDTWTTTSEGANAPDARFSQTAVWTGTEMIIWGGYGTYNLSTGGRYNPSTNSWISSSLTTGSGLHVPEGRSVHTAVWTGTEMIVWGGYGSESGFQGLNTGGRYNPSTDTWADSILVAGTADRTPSGRFRPTSVWTGTEMIVWGGYNGIAPEFPNTGGRYNPSSDSWAICSLTEGTGANVPDGREYFTAVWTDTEMIVWGGDSNIGYLRTGGRYKPSTDSWATTTLTAGTGAYIPVRRGYHTAIWTGSEMIVWGGYNDVGGGQALKDGGRYNPATDQWAHSSLTDGIGANLPPARDSHTAVWTGSEMIVWGGNGRTTGGRYNPSTDSWAASSLFFGTGANVPTGRTHYTAVWTGSTDRRMIIWGGLPLTASGGLYCAQDCLAMAWYQDADADGHGNATMIQSACTQPAGYVATGDDCNDADPVVYPGAPELNDGVDNQCPGEPGFGISDEIADTIQIGPGGVVCWTDSSGAATYEVAQSQNPDFSPCQIIGTASSASPCVTDPSVPPPGGTFYYIVRATAPHVGSWGQDSAGTERVLSCP